MLVSEIHKAHNGEEQLYVASRSRRSRERRCKVVSDAYIVQTCMSALEATVPAVQLPLVLLLVVRWLLGHRLYSSVIGDLHIQLLDRQYHTTRIPCDGLLKNNATPCRLTCDYRWSPLRLQVVSLEIPEAFSRDPRSSQRTMHTRI